MQLSAIQFTGARDYSSCGYCKQNNSFSDGMHAFQLNGEDYQDLIDRGWRRSGCYCYKPNNFKTCCPCYTIRCDTSEFKLSKSHKKILKTMKKFLHDGIKDDIGMREVSGECQIHEVHDKNAAPKISGSESTKYNLSKKLIKKLKVDPEAEESETEVKSRDPAISDPGTSDEIASNVKIMLDDSPERIEEQSNIKPVQKKAKQLRIERKKVKLEAKGISLECLKPNAPKNPEKTLTDFINEANSESLCHKLKIVLVSSTNKGEIIDQEFNLYYKYQNIIHNDPPDKITRSQFTRFLCNTPIQIKDVEVNSKEFNASLSAVFKLYKKYQSAIHNDIVYDEDEFIDFLQQSPLKLDQSAKAPPNGCGSFHQQYWLDDKLIAVGVIDILPKCVSSVYFFYDPDYNFLSLGTYGCLREIDFTRQLSETVPELKFYYLGFYIHSCPKMRYKGKLAASYLLCPEKYSWHLLSDEVKQKLDENKYVIFNTKANEKDANEFKQNYLDDIQILFTKSGETTYTPYKTFKRVTNTIIDDDLINFGKLVGKKCCRRILYCK